VITRAGLTMKQKITKSKGKVFLFGEYSVLFGGIALVTTANRYAICSFYPSDDLSFTAITDHEENNADHPLFKTVQYALKQNSIKLPYGYYTLDTRDFFKKNRKLGLGSSAAATVALVQMVFHINGIKNQRLLIDVAIEAHKELNQGGSGADIAASVFGKAIIYQKDQDPRALVKPLRSAIKEAIFIDTTQSQITSEYTKRAYAFARKHPHVINNFTKNSDAICHSLINENSLSMTHLINSIQSAFKLLDDFGQMAGIDITAKEHQEIRNIALAHHGAAKPCGAGGGDISLAVVPWENKYAFISDIFKSKFDVLNLIE
jgi:mevalonate kinase